MTLQDFERHISPKILQRGREYFENDWVTEVTRESSGKWTAIVEGSEDYFVEVELLGDEIVNWECDCPYDYGDECKHVVALLYYLQKHRDEHEYADVVEVHEDPLENKYKELFNYVNKKEIVAFVCEYATENKDFQEKLEARFLQRKKQIATIDYQKEVEKCFKVRNAGYDYYGNPQECPIIADNLDKLIKKAQFLIKQTHYEEAASILLCILEEVGSCYEDYEDYDGDLGSACQDAGEALAELISHDISEELKTVLIYRLGDLIKNNVFDNYDLADIKQLLFDLSLKTNNINVALKNIDEALKAEPDSFRTSSLVKTKLDLLEKTGQKDEMEQIIDQYLYCPEIRKIRLEKLLLEKAYEQALILIDGGIKEAQEKNHPGTVSDWKDEKLRIYMLLKDKNSIIALAEDLFVNGRERMKYFDILKKTVPQQEWGVYLDGFLEKANKASRLGINASTLAQIFIEEKYWDRLLELVESSKSNYFSFKMHLVEDYDTYLFPHYPEKVFAIYKKCLLDYAEKNMGRNHYQYIAQTLKKIKNYPNGDTLVQSLLEHFRVIYKKRPAMMEELKGV